MKAGARTTPRLAVATTYAPLLDLASFTAGQGEQLRRALGAKKGRVRIIALRDQFISGALRNNVPAPVAEAVFAQLEAFGGYSFPKSHAAAFAVIVYQSAWLKCYHPAVLLCALLNNQPMGFWPPAILVRDAQRHGVTVLPLDIHTSGEHCTLEGRAVRLGLNYVAGLGEQGALRILNARYVHRFADLPAHQAPTCSGRAADRRWGIRLLGCPSRASLAARHAAVRG